MLGTDLFVEMFFVLSGLVLWLPIARACIDGRAGRPGWVMLLRRMARLLPLYYAVVLVVWTLTNPSLPGHWQDLLLHLTFTQVYSDQYIFWTAGPAWSLAVEFHFYVLMALSVPVVHALARRAAGRAGRVAAVSALPVALVAVGLGYLYWAIQVADISAHQLVGLVLPALAGRGLRHRHGPGRGRRRRRPAPPARRACATTVARGRRAAGPGAASAPSPRPASGGTRCTPPPSRWPVRDRAARRPVAGVLEWRPLAWVGSLGYGIYLIHEPVLRLLDSLGVLPEAGPGMTVPGQRGAGRRTHRAAGLAQLPDHRDRRPQAAGHHRRQRQRPRLLPARRRQPGVTWR